MSRVSQAVFPSCTSAAATVAVIDFVDDPR